jgi:DNA replication and repair protein RecF
MLAVEAGYESKGKRKRVAVDGTEADRLGDAIGHIGAVIFSPSDVTIVSGAPSERRRFLDILLSLNVPGYLPALQRYRQVLRQRNAMLKANARPALLDPWNEQLSEWGAKLMVARARWTQEHAPGFTSRYRAIGGDRDGHIAYRPGTRAAPDDVVDAARMRDRFVEGLERAAARERERGVTLTGPHRDDLAITIEGPHGSADLRDFGSGGQVRTAAIALRMIEAETVRSARARPPLLLLDDVFAELDAGRSLRILELLEAHLGQVIMTAPKASDIQLRRPGSDGFVPVPLAQWRIEAGKVFT